MQMYTPDNELKIGQEIQEAQNEFEALKVEGVCTISRIIYWRLKYEGFCKKCLDDWENYIVPDDFTVPFASIQYKGYELWEFSNRLNYLIQHYDTKENCKEAIAEYQEVMGNRDSVSTWLSKWNPLHQELANFYDYHTDQYDDFRTPNLLYVYKGENTLSIAGFEHILEFLRIYDSYEGKHK